MRRPEPAPRTLLIVALAAATPIGAALYSVVAPSIFVPRTLIASLPALCLALGALTAWLPRPWGAGFAAALLAACAVGTAHVLTDERRARLSGGRARDQRPRRPL